MKKILQLIALATVGLLISGASEAGSSYKKIVQIVKIEAEQVTEQTNALGIELHTGRKVHLNNIVKKTFKKKSILEILDRNQIELSNGEVIYPEEVQYALVKESRLIKIGDFDRTPLDNDQ